MSDNKHVIVVERPPFEARSTSQIYKKPPRALTHKPISVSNEVHARLMQIQIEMQAKSMRKISFDEVLVALLAERDGVVPEQEQG